MKGLRRGTWLGIASLVLVALAAAACGETKEVVRTVEVEKPVIVEKVVVKEVPVERIVEKPVVQVVEKQVVVTKEVPKEVVVTKEVIKEIPKEVVKTVVVEKPVVVEKQVVVIKEVVKEVPKEVVVIKEVPAKAKEKVLRARMANMPPSFPPHTVGSGAEVIVMGLLYSSLIQPNTKDQRWDPNLAERWEVAPDFSSWTFFLRKGAVWHDGTPVTSKDVAFTVKSFLNPDEGSWMLTTFKSVKGADAFLAGKASDVPGVVIIDDRTIKFIMEKPSIAFLETLNTVCGLSQVPILPAHLLGAIPPKQILEHKFWVDGLVGSGPFKFVQWVPDQFMEVKANDNYYLGRPKVDRVILSVIPSPDATQIAMQRGEIDATIRGSLSADGNKAMLNDPRFDVYATRSTVAEGFGFNNRIKDIADPRLHQAWLYALDRQKLIDRFQEGLATIINTALIHPWYQNPEWDKLYPYDPAKAKALLKEMGWNSNRVITVGIGDITSEEQRARYLTEQQMLGDAGIKIEYKTHTAGVDEWYGTHTLEVLRSGWGTFGDPDTWLSYVTRPLAEGEFYYYKPELTALINKAASQTNRSDRIKTYQQINEEYLLKDLPFAGLSVASNVKVKTKRFVMPTLGTIPKPDIIGKVRVYPVLVGRDDHWIDHVEQWDISE